MIQVTCHQCGAIFCAKRRTRKFCDDACRNAQRDQNSEPQNAQNSPTQARREADFFGYHSNLCSTYYALPPTDRVVWLRNLIERARQGDTAVKRVLTNAVLLQPKAYNLSPGAMYSKHLPTLPQEAHALAKFMWDAGIRHVIENPDLPTHAERVERDQENIQKTHAKLFDRALKKLPKFDRDTQHDHTKLAYLTSIMLGGGGPAISDEHRARWGLV